ncbi:MAG: hypothetical protein JWN72_2325, partial [Thermoleophilia bacterium]|nr:hypothetical protein [Thermoleophilia bacterium]
MLPSPRTWLTIAAALSLLTALVAASSTSFAASSSSTVVSANVLSSTTLDLTGCGATTRDFGLVQPLATVRSSGACAVAFSSSNSTATLSASQRDRFGTAMTQASSVWTARSGTATYSAVDATSSSDLWVGGSPLIPGTAVLRHSVDSGATWSDVTPCAGATDIKELIAYSATEVLTVGNKVCRTTDGGATWSIIATPFALPTGPHLGAAAGTNVVWLNANGGGRVMRSADRGQTWTAITIPAISYGIRTIAARGTTTVVAMADRVNVGGTTRSMLAYSSTDSGVTWNEAVVRTTSTLTSSVGDVDVSTSGRFAVLGSAGYGLWSSDDNGVTWASRGTPGVVRLRHLVGTTWLTTNYQFGNMRISTDDAVSWSSFFPNGGDPRSIIQAVTKERGTNHVVMVGSNEQVLRSTTLGATWSPV